MMEIGWGVRWWWGLGGFVLEGVEGERGYGMGGWVGDGGMGLFFMVVEILEWGGVWRYYLFWEVLILFGVWVGKGGLVWGGGVWCSGWRVFLGW